MKAAQFWAFQTPSPSSTTYQYCSSAKLANSSTPLPPPLCGRHMYMVPKGTNIQSGELYCYLLPKSTTCRWKMRRRQLRIRASPSECRQEMRRGMRPLERKAIQSGELVLRGGGTMFTVLVDYKQHSQQTFHTKISPITFRESKIPCEMFGKNIKVVRCYSCYARKFRIHFDY